jgi:hypothetical protein
MDKTSPREVLLSYGKWINSTALSKLIAEKKKVTERQAKTDINRAYRNKQIKKHVFPDRSVIYGLDEFGPPTSAQAEKKTEISDAEKIRKAIEELRNEFRFFKEPTAKDVALKVGINPTTVESILYELAPQTGWSETDEKTEKKDAEDALNLAGYLACEKSAESNPELKQKLEEAKAKASKRVQQRAQKILNNYPNLVPKIDSTYLVWPKQTQTEWYRIFKTQPPIPHKPSEGIGIAFPRKNQKNENSQFQQFFTK